MPPNEPRAASLASLFRKRKEAPSYQDIHHLRKRRKFRQRNLVIAFVVAQLLIMAFSLTEAFNGYYLGQCLTVALSLVNFCFYLIYYQYFYKKYNRLAFGEPGIVIWWLCCLRIGHQQQPRKEAESRRTESVSSAVSIQSLASSLSDLHDSAGNSKTPQEVSQAMKYRVSVKQSLDLNVAKPSLAINTGEDLPLEQIKESINDSEVDFSEADPAEERSLSEIFENSIEPRHSSIGSKNSQEAQHVIRKRGLGESVCHLVSFQFISNPIKLYCSVACYWVIFLFIVLTSYLLLGDYAHLNMADYTQTLLDNTRDHFYETCRVVIAELSSTTKLSECSIASLEECSGNDPKNPERGLKEALRQQGLTQFFANSIDEVMTRIEFCSFLYYGRDFDDADVNLDTFTAIFGTRSQLFGYYNMFLVDVVGCTPDIEVSNAAEFSSWTPLTQRLYETKRKKCDEFISRSPSEEVLETSFLSAVTVFGYRDFNCGPKAKGWEQAVCSLSTNYPFEEIVEFYQCLNSNYTRTAEKREGFSRKFDTFKAMEVFYRDYYQSDVDEALSPVGGYNMC